MTSDFQVGQAASDFTTQAYVVKYLIRVGRQVKYAPKTSDVICECSLGQIPIIKPKTPLALNAFSFSFAKSLNYKVCRQNSPINSYIHERWKNSSHLAKKLGLIGVCKSSFTQYSTTAVLVINLTLIFIEQLLHHKPRQSSSQ